MQGKRRDERVVSLFRDGPDQAVRIPREHGLAEYLARPCKPITRRFPDVEDFPLNDDDIFWVAAASTAAGHVISCP